MATLYIFELVPFEKLKLEGTSRGTDKQDSGKGVAGYRIVRTDLKNMIGSS